LYCPKCGYEVSDDWRVCPNCAASLPQSYHPSQDTVIIPGTESKGPPAWLYGLGAAIIIIPIVLAIVFLIVDLFESNPNTRVVVPGTHELHLDSGKYIIFYEYQSSIDGKGYSTGEYLKGVVVSLHSEGTSQLIPVSTASGDMSYQIGSRAGKSLFEFEIEESGSYILVVRYQDGSSSPEVVFALGPQFDILGVILRSIGIGFAGFIVGGILILWVLIKRRRSREQFSGMPLDPTVSPRSRLAVTLLAFFVGSLGIHRFYLEKYFTGILMLLTLGGFGLWALIDFIFAVTGSMKDKDGKPISNWE